MYHDYNYHDKPIQDGLDWAVVTLDEPINNAYYFACTYDAATTFQNTVARVIGYPGGNPAASGLYDLGHYLYMSIGNVVNITNLMVRHEAAAVQGNSGSPIIGNGNLCSAIHVYDIVNGFDSTGYEIYENYGTKITSEIYDTKGDNIYYEKNFFHFSSHLHNPPISKLQ